MAAASPMSSLPAAGPQPGRLCRACAGAPTIGVLVALQVLRRVGNFAVARPTREFCSLFCSREDKYKAKSFLDTAVYRAGDQVGSWSYALLSTIGLALAGISLVAVPLSALWIALSYWLGRRQEAAVEDRARHDKDRACASVIARGSSLRSGRRALCRRSHYRESERAAISSPEDSRAPVSSTADRWRRDAMEAVEEGIFICLEPDPRHRRRRLGRQTNTCLTFISAAQRRRRETVRASLRATAQPRRTSEPAKIPPGSAACFPDGPAAPRSAAARRGRAPGCRANPVALGQILVDPGVNELVQPAEFARPAGCQWRELFARRNGLGPRFQHLREIARSIGVCPHLVHVTGAVIPAAERAHERGRVHYLGFLRDDQILAAGQRVPFGSFASAARTAVRWFKSS